jgi:hypothetical protein
VRHLAIYTRRPARQGGIRATVGTGCYAFSIEELTICLGTAHIHI